MKYRRILTSTGLAIPDLLYVEIPEGIYAWHPSDSALWTKRRLAALTTADVAQSGHADELVLSPLLEDLRELSELTGDVELQRAA